MTIWLVKRYKQPFDDILMEIVDAFTKEEDANACELNLILHMSEDDHRDRVEYVVEPLEVKLAY